MTPHRVESDSEDSDESHSSPIRKQPSRRRGRDVTPLPHLDFTDARPTRIAKSSSEQKENDARAEEDKDATIAALKKKVKNLTRKNEKTNSQLRDHYAEQAPPESEEEQDPVPLSAYSASFTSRGVVASITPQAAPRKLRAGNSGDTPSVTPMSRAPLVEIDENSNLGPPPSDDFEMLDSSSTIIGNDGDTPHATERRKRAHSPSVSASDVGPAKKARKQSTTAAEPSKVQAQFVTGKAPGGSRTKLKDYTTPAAQLISTAQHLYEIYIYCRRAYPQSEVQTEWADEIWEKVTTEKKSPMELTDRMSTMIRKYGVHARSSLVGAVRPIVGPAYKLKTGSSAERILKNKRKVTALIKDSAFHYKNPKTLEGYAGHPIIAQCLQRLFFQNKTSRGIVYSEYFSPITLETLALILTAIEFCIEEYSTGSFVQATFDEGTSKKRYEDLLADLADWDSLKPDVTKKIRQQLHDEGRIGAGVKLHKPSGRLTAENRSRALKELEAREVNGGINGDAPVEDVSEDSDDDANS